MRAPLNVIPCIGRTQNIAPAKFSCYSAHCTHWTLLLLLLLPVCRFFFFIYLFIHSTKHCTTGAVVTPHYKSKSWQRFISTTEQITCYRFIFWSMDCMYCTSRPEKKSFLAISRNFADKFNKNQRKKKKNYTQKKHSWRDIYIMLFLIFALSLFLFLAQYIWFDFWVLAKILSIIMRLATHCRHCYRHVTSFITYHNLKCLVDAERFHHFQFVCLMFLSLSLSLFGCLTDGTQRPSRKERWDTFNFNDGSLNIQLINLNGSQCACRAYAFDAMKITTTTTCQRNRDKIASELFFEWGFDWIPWIYSKMISDKGAQSPCQKF